MAEGAREGLECPRTSLTAAYLDGELEPSAAAEFDAHARGCAACASALLEQRRLLCLLDSAFDDTFEKRVALPEGFTRQLKARAELSDSCLLLMKQAMDELGLSARAYDKVRRVARTIADIDGSPQVRSSHVAEAVQYRLLDRKF